MLSDDIAEIRAMSPQHPHRKRLITFAIGLQRQRKRLESNFQAWERKIRAMRIAALLYPDDADKRESLAVELSIFCYFKPDLFDELELQLTGKRL